VVRPAAAITGPGRVNLIGDHTDYNRGLALPMAIGMGVTVRWRPGPAGAISVTSDAFGTAVLPAGLTGWRPDPERLALVEPGWARLSAAMAILCRPERAGRLDITASLPRGAGLSSSAALTVALCEAWAADLTVGEVARRCQQAEHLTGAPVGVMDPLVCAGARAGHAMLIDFSTGDWDHVPVPAGMEVVVVDSGQRRTVRSSAYAERVAECREAATVIGPLGLARDSDLAALSRPVLRRRARHVVEECGRVRSFAGAMAAGDLVAAGALMRESHTSLSRLFGVSTDRLDRLVDWLSSRPGVYGARMTGAGFGGCVVALAEPGALPPGRLPGRLPGPAWSVSAVDGTVARRG
jgi:galactokinase